MLPNHRRKGLFVFSDPGGAKPLLAYITLNNIGTSSFVVSDRTYDFYSDFNIKVHKYIGKSASEIIEKIKPDYIFTGTSYTSNIELIFIKAGKKAGVPTYTFIDHYTSIPERFKLNDVDYIFPDFVCVIDEKAKKIANETLSDVVVLNTGNFYHTFLNKWIPAIDKKNFFKQIGVPLSNKLLVFAPDPLSNVGGIETYGLDETTVWKNFASALNYLSEKNFTVIVKLHPNQKLDRIVPQINQYKKAKIICADNIHINTILYHSDIVIGMFSSILLESAIMGKQIIRCLIGLTIEDPFKSNDVGYAVNSEQEFQKKLYELISK